MIGALRALGRDPRPRDRNRPGTRCALHACGGLTHEGKPYCKTHLFALDQPRTIHEEVLRRAQELEDAAAGRVARIDVRGTRAQELLDVLREFGELRATTIVTKLQLDLVGRKKRHTAVETYLRALAREKLVVLKREKDRRGAQIVKVRLP